MEKSKTLGLHFVSFSGHRDSMNILLGGEKSYLLAFTPNVKPSNIESVLSGRNIIGITAPQKCLDLFLCVFQLFIVTRMFNGLIETNMKIW